MEAIWIIVSGWVLVFALIIILPDLTTGIHTLRHRLPPESWDADYVAIAAMERVEWGQTFHHVTNNDECQCDTCKYHRRAHSEMMSAARQLQEWTRCPADDIAYVNWQHHEAIYHSPPQPRIKPLRRMDARHWQRCLLCGWEGYSDTHKCNDC
jgi:hypothetical protein